MSIETMSTTEALQEAPALLFTDAAARKVGDLIRGEGNPKLMLRVFVQGGGCSGLQYGFEFDEQIQDGDTCIENLGVKLLVDPRSEEHTSELQSLRHLVCRLLLEKKKNKTTKLNST